jgi:hypothetical protein
MPLPEPTLRLTQLGMAGASAVQVEFEEPGQPPHG